VTVEGCSACDDAPSDARWADRPTTFDGSESTQKKARIELRAPVFYRGRWSPCTPAK
jgi:hypothetical protein